MEFFSIFFGLSLIGIGFLIKKYPNSMSGYNTMTYRQKKNVDIESLTSTYKKGFTIIGIVTSLGSLFFIWMKLYVVATILLIAPLMVGILILMVITQKYDHNKQSKLKRNLPVIVVSGIIIVITIFFLYSASPTKVEFLDNSMKFTGHYGVTIQTNQIEKVELLDNIPHIKTRTNGLGLGNILKGHFRLSELGKCRLFLRLPNPPYLYIELTGGDKILFNSTDPTYTLDIYNKIKLVK